MSAHRLMLCFWLVIISWLMAIVGTAHIMYGAGYSQAQRDFPARQQCNAKPGAEDVQAMAARTLWMEELFFLDGRDMISHPQHGLFTGLALKYQSLQSTDGY